MVVVYRCRALQRAGAARRRVVVVKLEILRCKGGTHTYRERIKISANFFVFLLQFIVLVVDCYKFAVSMLCDAHN